MNHREKIDRDPAHAAVCAWENEGGALAPHSHVELSVAENQGTEDILIHLGSLVVSHWESLPIRFKRTVFRPGAVKEDVPKSNLKERMARFLHVNNKEFPSGGPA